ncbi:MAG: hypothetical protein P0Y64_14615 [Candidatus Sphingomonas colombiensis]|nr:hypothetical protein [Sphingomonas sp.]WEK42602.1 MAG: hypothetical protein P0Y64_14615 [Sphingomonas sp.]
MNDTPSIRPGDQQCVTASQLVRHFGLWQERAARAPVYILHRGRPRYALTSIDVMEALCAPLSVAPADNNALATLLDADGTIAMILDREGRVALASSAARARYGAVMRSSSRPGEIASSGGAMLDDAIARVIASGIAESIEIVPETFLSRRLRCDLTPFPTGCLLRAVDVTTEQALAAIRAQLLAMSEAGAASGAINVRINLRGYVVAPSPDLAALTGIAAEALATARFASLLTVGSRVQAGHALDAVATDGIARSVTAECLIHGAAPMPVAIGVGAVTIAGRIEELAITIVRAVA